MTLRVLTVYNDDQERGTVGERIGLAWLEDEPEELDAYRIRAYLFDDQEEVADGELIYVCGYTVIFPEETAGGEEEALLRTGYEFSEEEGYRKNEHLILLINSAFSEE